MPKKSSAYARKNKKINYLAYFFLSSDNLFVAGFLWYNLSGIFFLLERKVKDGI